MNLLVNFLEDVAYSCECNRYILLSGNVILTHRVVQDWKSQCNKFFWTQCKGGFLKIIELEEYKMQRVIERGWHVKSELAELQDM